jgi:linoleoyl-CoA desaturase
MNTSTSPGPTPFDGPLFLGAAPQAAPSNGFYRGLRQTVYTFLDENGLEPVDTKGMATKAALSYALWVVSYGAYLGLGHYAGWHAVWALPPLLLALLCIQLSVMHDGSHGAFGRSSTLNRLAAWSLGFAGASAVLWHKSHVQAHHGHTNVKGDDEDFETDGLIRLHDANPRHPLHRFQHLYAVPLYSMHSLKWIWWDDWHDLATNRWGLSPKRRRAAVLEAAVAKVWHITAFLVVPALVIDNLAVVLTVYLVHFLLLGIALTMTFLMAHMTGIQETPADRSGVHDDWALHQLATTANFATGNRLLGWVIGGLNFQIEHHIFPQISHTRHRRIHPIVKAYCEARGVTYHEYPTFRSVLADHFRNLRNLGRRAATETGA